MKFSKLGMKNKKGFSTATAVIAGVISIAFLIVFAFLFLTQLTSTNILAANSIGANASNQLIGNFSNGVAQVNTSIPTVMAIAVFVLIVVVLLIAYAVARKNGLLGGGQLG